MTFNSDQMNRQMNFTLTIAALESLLKEGILTKDEFKESVRIMDSKYKPIFSYKC